MPANNDGSFFKKAHELAIEAYHAVGRALAPWAGFPEVDEDPSKTETANRESEALKMLEKWENAYGKLDDPAIQAKIKAIVDTKDEDEAPPENVQWLQRF